ncbi:YwbE family protein [Paenibacillus sp. D2_2]|uniref:YwbE family protein n=1 Tax=Paenibacillus sp. D2_2 TaxID=3073092 RepID=UPI0028164D5D|nr:YwbE family protein [Paenibacillus sp. D2_2]WMT43396.1 YwbE family protein [Paenibacillus sp. D2_2]
MVGSGRTRSNVRPGLEVEIVLKKDQRTGALTRGIVKDILTNSPSHPHGIKVRLQDGQVGRVQAIIGARANSSDTSGNS